MPPVFLHGVRIPDECTRILVNTIGPLNETCVHCGGSVLQIKSVKINSLPNLLFRIWCATTCGRYADLSYELPYQGYRDLVRNLEIEIHRIF
jgi:hypothetical protein